MILRRTGRLQLQWRLRSHLPYRCHRPTLPNSKGVWLVNFRLTPIITESSVFVGKKPGIPRTGPKNRRFEPDLPPKYCRGWLDNR